MTRAAKTALPATCVTVVLLANSELAVTNRAQVTVKEVYVIGSRATAQMDAMRTTPETHATGV